MKGREDHTVKKLVALLMILFTISLAGGLYHTFAQLDNVGQETIDNAFAEQFYHAMPDIILNPTPVVLLY